jgi:hypothetical protein
MKFFQASRNQIRRWVYPHNQPDFIILGAQKSGTSSLYACLNQHHQICGGSGLKEPNYFNRDIYFGKSYNQYLSNFAGSSKKLYFEATPEYLYHPDTALQIYKYLPNTKMIVVLREPCMRAFSAWNHYRCLFVNGRYRQAIEDMPRRDGNLLFDKFFKGRSAFPTFEESINIELELIEREIGFEPALLRRGLYLQQLEQYWNLFDKRQILIIGFKSLINNSQETMESIIDFLGLESYRHTKFNFTPMNRQPYGDTLTDNQLGFLSDFYAESNQLLFERVGVVDW